MSNNKSYRSQTRVLAYCDLAISSIQLVAYVILIIKLSVAVYSRDGLDLNLNWLFKWLNYEGFEGKSADSALVTMQVNLLTVLILWALFKLMCIDDIVKLIMATNMETSPHRALAATEIWWRGTVEFLILDVVFIFHSQLFWLLLLKLVPVAFLYQVQNFQEELVKEIEVSSPNKSKPVPDEEEKKER